MWEKRSSAFHLSVQVSLVLGITDIKFKTQENVDNNWRISLDNNFRWNRFIPVKAFRLEWCIKQIILISWMKGGMSCGP